MIEVVYYDENVRCYRNGVVERCFKVSNQFGKKGEWKIVEHIDNCHGYNHTKIDDKNIARHRLIAFCWLGLTDIDGETGQDNQIDHIDGNKLNNHADNLRVVTNQQNQWNHTKAKGYYWNKNSKKWHSQIGLNNKTIHVGFFETEADARQAYLNAKLKYHPIQ